MNSPDLPSTPPSPSRDPLLERLTEREKECLRLWLGHRTAKQIALDLGISHHAVEKRLKMARTKLDVTSSIDAAKMLAASEEYGDTGPQAPDLVKDRHDRPDSKLRYAKMGVFLMIVSTVIALGLALQGGGTPTMVPSDEEASGAVVLEGSDLAYEKVTDEELRDWLGWIFRTTDTDESGFIEVGEAPKNFASQDDVLGTVILTGISAQQAFMEANDANKDGRVSESEFIEPAFLAFRERGRPVLPAALKPMQ